MENKTDILCFAANKVENLLMKIEEMDLNCDAEIFDSLVEVAGILHGTYA